MQLHHFFINLTSLPFKTLLSSIAFLNFLIEDNSIPTLKLKSFLISYSSSNLITLGLSPQLSSFVPLSSSLVICSFPVYCVIKLWWGGSVVATPSTLDVLLGSPTFGPKLNPSLNPQSNPFILSSSPLSKCIPLTDSSLDYLE